MHDLVFIMAMLVLAALAVLFTAGCRRLMGSEDEATAEVGRRGGPPTSSDPDGGAR